MAPTFVKGDVLTIDHDVYWESGDYMLVGFGDPPVHGQRDNDHFDFMPENPVDPQFWTTVPQIHAVSFQQSGTLMEPLRHLT